MTIGSYRDTWAEISLDAIANNVKMFKKYIRSNTKLMAVVKADGYGHGAVEVAKAALEAGANYLAVAFLDEAIQLRDAGIEVPLLVLGYTGIHSEEAIQTAINKNIVLTVFTEEIAREIVQVAEKLKKVAKVHMKIDTGMHRIGVKKKEDALHLAKKLQSSYVEIEGIFTHFADADNPDDTTYTEKQFSHFEMVVSYLADHGFHIPIKHCCNSAGTIAYPHMHLDMVRVGISLYGLYPSDHLREKIDLVQVMSFHTKPIFIKQLQAGDTISYGCTYTPDEEKVVATIPVGYADGFNRRLSNKGHVTVKGKRVPIVGRICMDQSMIDITTLEEMKEDETVTIFGDPMEGYISLGEVADQLDTIHYELVCLIGKRVPRVYVKNGEIQTSKGLL